MESFTTENVISGSHAAVYKARQMDSFGWLQTKPLDWKLAEIIGDNMEVFEPVDQTKFLLVTARKTIFKVPKDYKVVTPASSMPAELRKVEIPQIEGALVCQLCGHPIEYQYPIVCEANKLVMYIGVDCADHFYGAGYIYKQIRVYQDSKLRELFRAWRENALDELYTLWQSEDPRVRPSFQTKAAEGGNPKIVVCTLDTWTGKCNTRMLSDPKTIRDHYKRKHSWYYMKEPDSVKDLGKRLQTNQGLQSRRCLVNTFKRAQTFGLKLPKEIEAIFATTEIEQL